MILPLSYAVNALLDILAAMVLVNLAHHYPIALHAKQVMLAPAVLKIID